MIAVRQIVYLSVVSVLVARATAPKVAAPPAQAPAKAPAAAPAAAPDDYFPPGVALAAGRIESFMGDLYTVPFQT